MKRFYAHFSEWEDARNGLYESKFSQDEVNNSYELLTNNEEFSIIGQKVLNEWKVSTKIQLSNPSRNKIAWLGQASCCYKYGSNENNTKIAWGNMTEEQRTKANETARNLINNHWENG